MLTGDIQASRARAGWFSRTWHKVATVLAVIGLVDLTGQLVKWAAVIHWIAEKYAIVRAWFFGSLPFHIPPEWHDPIVLFLILLSVVNVGVYRRTGHTAISLVFYFIGIWTVVGLIAFSALFFALGMLSPEDRVEGFFVACLFLLPLVASPFFLAWRWVLSTAAIFGALIAINYAYVQWIGPWTEHPALPGLTRDQIVR